MSKPLPDRELAAKIATLVERGRIDQGAPAYGVALAAIDLGYDRLTRAQKRLYDREVAPAIAWLEAGAPAEPASEQRQRGNGATAGWKPIRTAPEGEMVALAVEADGRMNALAFACRRSRGAWVNAATGKPVYIRPSHWREWTAE